MIHTWSEFRLEISKFFLPTRFLSYIENLYFARKQRQREKARDYILDLLALAKQHPNLRNRDHLDRLYDNLLPEYRLQFSLDRITSISDLATKCNEYEQLRHEENRDHRNDDRRDDRPNRHVKHALTGYSRETHCWRCKKAGHNRYKCMNDPVLFCSHCGRNDVLSRSCPCAKTMMQKPPAKVACARQLQFQRIFIQIKIKNLNFRALIDTGASQTFISEATLRSLRNEGLQPEPHSEQIQVANQDYITCKYRLQIPVTLNNITTYHSAVVANHLAESLILGMDFLTMRRYSLTLDNQPIRQLPSRKYQMPVLHGLDSQQNLSHEENPTERSNQLTKASQNQQKYFNRKRRKYTPTLGQKVFTRDFPLSSAIKNFAQKLAPKYSGPYVITTILSRNIVELTQPASQIKICCHVQDLKPFYSSNSSLNLHFKMEQTLTRPLAPGIIRKMVIDDNWLTPQPISQLVRPIEAVPRVRPLAPTHLFEQRRIKLIDRQNRMPKARKIRPSRRREIHHLACITTTSQAISPDTHTTTTRPEIQASSTTTNTPPERPIITDVQIVNPPTPDVFKNIKIEKKRNPTPGEKFHMRHSGRKVEVTILDNIHARLRCNGHEKVIPMT